MKNVILVKLEEDSDSHKIAPPFSLLYLADALEKNGYAVHLFHEPASKSNMEDLMQIIADKNPVFVGFSCFTNFSLLHSKRASLEIKKNFDVPVVWGGIHPTILPEQTLENEFIDIIGVGEGEEMVVELAEVLKRDHYSACDLRRIQGIGFREDGKTVLTERRPFIKKLDKYSPAWHLVDVDKYIYSGNHFYSQIGSKLSGEKVAAMYTSRGCPWRCGYCYNQAVNQRTFRTHSAEKIIQEIQFWKERGVTTVIFEDDNFFSNKQRVFDIIRNADIKWSATIRADYIDRWGEDFVGELSRNGCIELRIGAESGSQKMLDIMQKDITPDQVRKAVALCDEFGINTLLNFMVGVSGETWEDVIATLDFMDELGSQSKYASIGSPAVFVPWPGTRLSELAETEGLKPPQTLEGWTKQWAQRSKLAPYHDKRIKFLGFYKSLLRRNPDRLKFPFFVKILQKIAKARWEKRYFHLPLDYYVPQFFLSSLRKVGLRKISGAIYE